MLFYFFGLIVILNESNYLIRFELLIGRVKDLLKIKLKWGIQRKRCDFFGRRGWWKGGEGLKLLWGFGFLRFGGCVGFDFGRKRGLRIFLGYLFCVGEWFFKRRKKFVGEDIFMSFF